MIALKDIEQQLSEIRSGGFERIANNIELFSSSVDEGYLRDYLHSLVFDNRGNRMGFPKNVMKAIFEIHQKLPEQKADVWSEVMLK